MASKQKLFDATYPGAATPLTKNRLQQPIVLHRDTGYDKKHDDETDHFKAKDNHGVEFKYLYVGENYRLRPDSSGDCVVEAYDGSSWVEAVRIDSNGIEAEYFYVGESVRLREGTDELVIEAHDGSSWSEHLSLSTTSGVVDFSDMPEVSGDPVVESGSNSDGEWTRWADGTQVCWSAGVTLESSTSGNTDSGVRVGGITTWDFPISFDAKPSVSCVVRDATGTGGTNKAACATRSGNYISTTDAQFFAYEFDTATATIDIYASALGRWK